METLIPFLLVIILLSYLAYIYNKQKNKELETIDPSSTHIKNKMKPENKMKQEEQEAPQPDTLGLMLNTLNQLGCQPQANDDGTLSVQYQGENFFIEFGGMYARIWDPMWASVKADEPDLPKIREAINAANITSGPTVVLSTPNVEDVIEFHSRFDIMLHPACPDNVPFVKDILDSFFSAKEHVRYSLQQINAKQMEAQKNRRPVGFTTSSTSNE